MGGGGAKSGNIPTPTKLTLLCNVDQVSNLTRCALPLILRKIAGTDMLADGHGDRARHSRCKGKTWS